MLRKSLEKEQYFGNKVTHCTCTLAQKSQVEVFQKNGSIVVEKSRIGLTLNQHLTDNISDPKPCYSTKSN